MFSSFRFSTAFAAFGLTLALAAHPVSFAHAGVGAPSYEEGVLPEGMAWNTPLRAGDLVLPRLVKKKEKTVSAPLQAPSLPVGELKPPSIGATAAQDSTSGAMLLQGMKNALQRAGHNADIPKSDLQARQEIAATGSKVEDEIAAMEDFPVIEDAPPVSVDSGLRYQPGQEPRNLATMRSSASPAPAAVEESRATDMAEAPPSLAAVASGKAELPAPSPSKTSSSGGILSSIFGASVEDGPVVVDEEKAEEASSAPCEAKTVSWTRSCQEAGYPPYFAGAIEGETRTVCPSGEEREVWISNSCAAKLAGEAETASQTATARQTNEPKDGACGSANGLAAAAKPSTDLCLAGKASDVRGEGPFRWECAGSSGGMTVSCAAPLAAGKTTKEEPQLSKDKNALVVQDGKCGSAANVGQVFAPASGLCAQGTPSHVNGEGPWTWACGGLNGGRAEACIAQKKTDGVCGAATSAAISGRPEADLCAAGYASAVTGEGPWNWTCSGLYGGEAATCQAKPKVNAVCGSASAIGHRDAPKTGLCAAGAASAVSGEGPWHWTCEGQNDGASVSCQAQIVISGQCGPANGSAYRSGPEDGLCAKGRASRVTGEGPWYWTCLGSDGGDTASCTAALGTKETLAGLVACGSAAEALAFAKPSENLCASGKPSEVSGDGLWTWTCADDAGHSVSCSTLGGSDGVCGDATDKASSLPPQNRLCKGGMPSDVKADSENKNWVWTCRGAMGGSSVSCAAPLTGAAALAAPAKEEKTVEAACGEAAGRGFETVPDADLCAAGDPGAVRGTGPWTWTCKTSGRKGSSVECEALKRADGVCGAASGSVQGSAPEAGLCASGAPTAVRGQGPWMWSCVGLGGGGSASCSALSKAQTRVDGLCGAAADTAFTNPPDANLCDSGVPSAVYGEGPWTWTCSGLNGGIASTCGASKVVPKAPPPPGPFVNGLCGAANGVAMTSAPKKDELCSTGTATAISGSGPWNWSCIGMNGGMTVSCTAPLMPPAPVVGVCGASSGVPSLTTPKSALCAAGIASAVSGRGPWTWSCSGTNGGGAVSCVAPVAGKTSSEPLSSLTTPSLEAKREAPAPAASPVALVTPYLPAGPLPPLDPNVIPNRKILKPTGKAGNKAALSKEPIEPPEVAPQLPKGMVAIEPPDVRDELEATPGLSPPVLDSIGRPVAGAKLVLDPSVSSISFGAGDGQLDKSGVQVAEKLANILVLNREARITLMAYAGVGDGRSPRDARKLSLSRALALRDFLVSKGVETGRVDVRPMGANVTSGDMDRVDVKVN